VTRLSAVVPARGLTAHGRRCLDTLLALRDVEVVFVPDEAEPELDPRVVCVPSGPATVGAKRQLGLERSTGDLVALIDDDAYPHVTWLENVLDAFDDDPLVAAVCGPTLTPPADGELEQLGGRVYASPLVAGPHRWRYAPRRERDVDDAPSANLVLRRDDALAVGLESAHYPGDDTIVCQRLLERGGRIRYVPQAIAFHSRRPLWQPHLTQVWRFGRRRGAFARVFGGNSRRPAYFAPSALVVGAVAGAAVPQVRGLWAAGLGAYAAACLVAGADRRPGVWARLSAGIAATHATYGIAFLVGCLGPLPDEERD
jgi:hypothetical protein